MKTEEWLKTLEEPFRSQALGNMKVQILKNRVLPSDARDSVCDSCALALGTAFSWDESPQGRKYWEDLYNSIVYYG